MGTRPEWRKELMHAAFMRALDVLATPEGHRSGVYREMWGLMQTHCPDQCQRAARELQRTSYESKP